MHTIAGLGPWVPRVAGSRLSQGLSAYDGDLTRPLRTHVMLSHLLQEYTRLLIIL